MAIDVGARDILASALDWCDYGMLPEWEIALQQAKAAHRACSSYVFVGWDIAFTDHGPMLLEGNVNWNADEYQALSGEPLGCTQIAKVLKSHLGLCRTAAIRPDRTGQAMEFVHEAVAHTRPLLLQFVKAKLNILSPPFV